jgi:endonuclease YncB( thermonuclease family)
MLLLSPVANRALVAGQMVMRGKDVSETDRRGRLLRYGYLADGTVVNDELVRHGLAQVIIHLPDVNKETDIWAAEAEAWVEVCRRG